MNLLDDSMFLTTDDLPSSFVVANNKYSAHYYDSIFGKLQPDQSSSFEALDVVIQQAFTVSSYNILLKGHYMMSLFHFSIGDILFFDSHSRSEAGLVDPDGRAILLQFKSLQSFTQFLIVLCTSLHFEESTLVELKPVSIQLINNDAYGEQYKSSSTVPPSLTCLLKDDFNCDLSILPNNSSNIVHAAKLKRKTEQGIHSVPISSHARKRKRRILNTEVKGTHAKEFSATSVFGSTENHIIANSDPIEPIATDYDVCKQQFQDAIKQGPSFVCTAYLQTWFRHSVVQLKLLKVSDDITTLLAKCWIGYISMYEKEWICRTCVKHIKKGQIPRLSIVNNCHFPPKPPELNIHPLEERLLSPRIPFMQIRELPRGGQLSITGIL
ncbi:hypothetical protein HOLleu_01670 [Holothuria leucospilota]|uniref:Uncharacterized protein n=1 Tax=Holothuria leucospilota TaxID=206669 RepID=A0A9Q1CR57_HOLLE|nr:hypothetical protein HOLleu_01670 [Holothuria leucospilota]